MCVYVEALNVDIYDDCKYFFVHIQVHVFVHVAINAVYMTCTIVKLFV